MLYEISALANPESGRYSEIRPNPAPTKFLAGYQCGYQCSCSAFSQLWIKLTQKKINRAVVSNESGTKRTEKVLTRREKQNKKRDRSVNIRSRKIVLISVNPIRMKVRCVVGKICERGMSWVWNERVTEWWIVRVMMMKQMRWLVKRWIRKRQGEDGADEMNREVDLWQV